MKVLILTGKFGMGHYAASNSLSEQIKINIENSEIIIKDIFEYSVPSYSNAIYKAFTLLVSRGSGLYNIIYKRTENAKTDARPILQEYFLNKLDELIYETQPTIIISTLPFCSQLVSRYKRKYMSKIPLMTCITDISSHSEWINKNTDCYLVASDSTRRALIGKGVSPQKIFINGIPVKEEFKKMIHISTSEERHLLIMGGGLGLLPKSDSFYKELNALPNVKITVIAGNNKKMYAKLHGKYRNINVIGFTNKVCEYMQNSDLIISKPGGITLFEAIHSELPILVFHPFLQQEINNARFILANNFGRVLKKDPKTYINSIKNLIYNTNQLEEIRYNMRELKERLEGSTIEDALFILEESLLGVCA